ncbi:MAG: hypothetical protein RLZZ136_145 [Pseudomonadota bacterium]|jgi:cytoskeletal protein RodZ
MTEAVDEQPQLPLADAGSRLRLAREQAGLSRADVAAVTRISERLIVRIEEGDFAALPSRTHAFGFTRAFARAVSLDEHDIVEAVRREMGLSTQLEPLLAAALEPGDPARVPSARFAWSLAFAALLVVIMGLFFWQSYYAPAATLPALSPEATPTAMPEAVAVPSDAAASAVPSDGPDPTFTYVPQPKQHGPGSPAASTVSR